MMWNQGIIMEHILHSVPYLDFHNVLFSLSHNDIEDTIQIHKEQ